MIELSDLTGECGAALRAAAARVAEPRPGEWDVSTRRGARTTVRLDDGWLVLEAVLPLPAERSALLSGGLPCGALKPVERRDGQLTWRGEWPAGAEGGRPAAVLPAWLGDVDRLADRRGRSGLAEPGGPEWDPAELCTSAGWPPVERSTGCRVTLEAPGGLYQADLATAGSRLRARAALTDGLADAPPECVAAVATLLLRGNAVYRLARGWLADGAAGWEVELPVVPAPAELHEALAALSVAARCAREAEALVGDAALARAYLLRRGVAVPCDPGR